MINFVFDVDCVLTEPRTLMDPEFEKFFRQWIQGRSVYIVSGSTHADIKMQLGDIIDKVSGFFSCQGNVLHVGGKLIYDMVWHCEDLTETLQGFIDASKYPQHNGLIDIRSGMINFSTLGRASKEERAAYNKWDAATKERQTIVDYINTHFPQICATIGGQVSIDIAPYGCDKGQIRGKIKGPIYFFADQTQEGGNDWLLAKQLDPDTGDSIYTVKNWQETYRILRRLEYGAY